VAVVVMGGTTFCSQVVMPSVSGHQGDHDVTVAMTLVASLVTFVVCGMFLLLSILLGCDKRKAGFSDKLRRLYSVSTFEHDVSLSVRRHQSCVCTHPGFPGFESC
jgi:hypothetical protein